MRTIVRFSINNEDNARLRNHLVGILEDVGFRKVGTASWEHDSLGIEKLPEVMSDFWAAAADPQGRARADEGVAIDHVWTYTDEPAGERSGSD